MSYQQMQEIKDLLESCYVNMIAINLKKEVKAKIQEIKEEMKEMDSYMSWIEQKAEEAKYGKDLD